MDALALLCTLHADGPRTTRRLRYLGVQTLDALREMPTAELADALEASNNAAERFVREAEILLKRVRHEAVELEPKRKRPPAAPAKASRAKPKPARTPAPLTPPAASSGAGQALQALESARSSPAFGRPEPVATGPEDEPQDEGRLEPDVRNASERGAPAGTAEDQLGVARADEALETESDPTPGLQRYIINPLVRGPSTPLRVAYVPEAGAGSTIPLRPGLFGGLDDEVCRRLAASGVESVDDLARTSGLDLALDLSWPYDRVFHLKKEASHYLQAARIAPPEPIAPHAGVPRSGADQLDTPLAADDDSAAGPFA